jgi:hypothetical protein
MEGSDEARKQRALARANWRVSMHRLGEEPVDDEDGVVLSVAQRIGMVWRITQNAWALSGQQMPRYARSEMPGRMVRKHERT